MSAEGRAHRTRLEHVGWGGIWSECACGWHGKERTETELAIHDGEQHERYEQSRAALAAAPAAAAEGE